MTQKIFFALFSVVLINTAAAELAPPHLDLDATSREYEMLLKQSITIALDPEDLEIEKWLKIGQRNLEWVNVVNAQRPADQKISLSSPTTQPGNDVSQPRVYNFKIIQAAWADLQNKLPPALSDVIFGTLPLPSTIPGSEDEFIKWLLKTDKTYQISARYKLRKPWKDIMSGYIVSDVRGYLNIKADAKINQKLSQWSQLSAAAQSQLSQDLLKLCWNSGTAKGDCEESLILAISQNAVVVYKDKYFPYGKKNYDHFFIIPRKRKDVKWTTSNPNLFSLPFANPNDQKIMNFLRTNIEDEWKWKSWSIKLNFIKTSSVNTAHVKFVPGSTPNVNGLAGSQITMDKNSPLTEYDVQWTIRHEFGHVLGLPDCYLEFYDLSQEAFVSYQLDLKNLMCSRQGHLQQKHYDELKRVYYPL